jgi:hypothetical protein
LPTAAANDAIDHLSLIDLGVLASATTQCMRLGCTDSSAVNFHAAASQDDGSCFLSGPSTHFVDNTCQIDCASERRLFETEEDSMAVAMQAQADMLKHQMLDFLSRETNNPELLRKFNQYFGQPTFP